MKKIEVLQWAIRHIAGNHHTRGDYYNDWDTGDTILYTRASVPATHDVQMLAEDMGVREHCKVNAYSVEIRVPKTWVETTGQEEFVPKLGQMMWKRTAILLGGHLGYMAEEYDPFYERSGWFYRHYDSFTEAKEACDTECKRTRNGNLYSVWEMGLKENTECYCCQWSSEGRLEDITAQELSHQEEMRKEREKIIAELNNE